MDSNTHSAREPDRLASLVAANQELAAEGEASPPYWEGAVTYSGSHNGVGYLEMTGYSKPMRFQ